MKKFGDFFCNPHPSYQKPKVGSWLLTEGALKCLLINCFDALDQFLIVLFMTSGALVFLIVGLPS